MLTATYKIRDRDYYIAANNIPTGITPSTNRLFISIARKDYGIPSTLNYIDLRAARDQKSPMLRSYPNYEINELHVRIYAQNEIPKKQHFFNHK